MAKAYLILCYTFTDSQFKLINKMLTCLEIYFLTDIKKEEARNRFNNMYMQDKRRFRIRIVLYLIKQATHSHSITELGHKRPLEEGLLGDGSTPDPSQNKKE